MIEEFLNGGGGDQCGAPNPLQSLTRNVEGGRFSSFLQERWVPATDPSFDFQRPLCNDGEIHDALHNFIGSTVNGAPLVLPESAGTLAPEDHASFIARSTMLARQLAPEPQVGAANVASLASTFHVSPVPPPVAALQTTSWPGIDDDWTVGQEHLNMFEEAWGQAQQQQQQQQQQPPMSFHGALPQTLNSVGNDWATEFIGPSTGHAQEPVRPGDLEAAWKQAESVEEDNDKALEAAWGEAAAQGFPVESEGTALNTTPAESAAVQASAKQIAESMGADPLLEGTEFMKFMRQLGSGALKVEGNTVVEGTGNSSAEPIGPLSDAERFGFGEDTHAAADAWTDEFEGFESGAIPDRAFAIGGDYTFTSPAGNPFIGHVRAFAKGQELLAAGQTADAALAFEAAIAQHPENAEAWRLLGIAHADGDNDQQAIAALTAAHSLDPTNLATLLALAVSLCNDLHKERSVDALAEWVRTNPRYSALPVPPIEDIRRQTLANNSDVQQGFEGFDEMLESYSRCMQTLALFNEARATPAGQNDTDVHVALGLLYNLTYDYDQAAEMFRAALAQRPDDSMLWNKLGATLANSNKNEQAIEAYNHALRLRPGYIRAHSNLAISLVSANRPEEAAREFLRALELDPSADHIWENLKIAFSMMHREDLVQKTDFRTPDFFRSDIDF